MRRSTQRPEATPLSIGILALLALPACILDLDGLTGGGGATTGSAASSTTSSGTGGAAGGCPLLDCSCVSGPVAIAAGSMFADIPRGIALTADSVIWANHEGNTLARAAPGGPEILADTPHPRGVAVSGDTLVWTAEDGVHACTLPGCSDDVTVFPASVQGSLRGVAFDGQIVAWADRGMGTNDGEVRSCSLGSCAPVALGASLIAPENVVFHDTFAYFTDQANGNQNGSVTRSPKATGGPMSIAASLDLPTGVAADETHTYWTSFTPTGRVYRCAHATGYCDNPEDVAPAAGPLGRPDEIRVAGGRIYWTSADDGSISSCEVPGCGATQPVVHVTGRHGISKLVVGSSCLFWTEDEGGGAVLKAPR